jgi:uncharacterized protein (TIGR02265 family)
LSLERPEGRTDWRRDLALPTGPCARGTILLALRSAARLLWGDAGLAEIRGRMSPTAAVDLFDRPIVADAWMPEHYVTGWLEAAFGGPAQANVTVFRRFLDRMMDHGFGRVRAFLLSMVTPQLLLQKAPELWRHDHSCGELVVPTIAEQHCVVLLRNHVYTRAPLSRLAIAEIYRYALALSRAAGVEETHRLDDDGQLNVRISWR